MAQEQNTPEYKTWSSDKLVDRIIELERKLQTLTHTSDPAVPIPSAIQNDQQSPAEDATDGQNPKRRATKTPNVFDPSKYHTRLIALKFAYLGAGFNGFEHHIGNTTPLPTIEEEIWKALVKTRLIFPKTGESVETSLDPDKQKSEKKRLQAADAGHVPVNWDDCEYSKCGRTDKGVSAFGQVIGVRVRSARLREGKKRKAQADAEASGTVSEESSEGQQVETQLASEPQVNGAAVSVQDFTDEDPQLEPAFDPIENELPYTSLLNKVLPPTIRILAWCPSVPSNFSARFSCKERLYRYFFTNPAYLPAPYPPTDGDANSKGQKDGWLDIEAMKEAAGYLEGLHDYRNLCKVDPTKQLTNFKRRISHASVDVVSAQGLPTGLVSSFLPVGDTSAQVLALTGSTGLYAFTVRGSAFLWHQVRCMVAILFLVGQGLEEPDIVKQLLDVESNPCKPQYEMASDAPLVLWDCTFSKSAGVGYDIDSAEQSWDRGLGADELEWVYAGEDGPVQSSGKQAPSAAPSVAPWRKYDRKGIMEDLWIGWRAAKMNEILAAQLLDLVTGQGPQVKDVDGQDPAIASKIREAKANVRVFQGEEYAPSRGKYVPLMKRARNETVEVINARYLARRPEKAKYFPKNAKPVESSQE